MSNRVFIFITMVLGAAGCSVQRGESTIPDVDYGVSTDLGIVDASTSDEPLSIDGHWVLFTEDRRCIYPDLGDQVENIVWSFYLISMTSQPSESPLLTVDAELCHQYLSPLPFDFITIVPRRVTASLSHLDFTGFLVGRGTGGTFVTEPTTHLWGYEDADVAEPLPLSEEDERVFDQDDDGLPGVTLPIETPQGGAICEVRVVQRTTIQLEGAVANNRLITGTLNVEPEQVVLSASTGLCAGGDVQPSDATNRFELIKLPNELGNCDAIYQNLRQVQALLNTPEAEPDTAFCPLRNRE